MTSIVKQKWELSRQKNDKARELRHYSLREPQNHAPSLKLDYPATVYAYEDGYLYVSDSSVWEYPDRIWAMLEQLKDWADFHHPHFMAGLKELQEKDAEAARQARLAKILGAIGNNLDELPELKDELIKLGERLKKGEDIRPYCRNYGESDMSSS